MAATDRCIHTTTVVDRVSATPADLVALIGDGLGGVVERMEWAEEEIENARVRHPQAADQLYHAFQLLQPNSALDRAMSTEFVYRSHCRELLDRVAAGADTQPGTAAEVCSALCAVSLASPLRSSAAGLYMRMWQTAGFPEIPGVTEIDGHHEALEGSAIDEDEQFARRKLAMANRRLGDIVCSGHHRGEQVDCIYTPIGQLALGA